MAYKSCAVPQCKNTTIRTPNKLFVTVPKNAIKRKKWLKLARRNVNDIHPKTAIYFCEDHFNMETDMTNYYQYKMGFSKLLIMGDKVLPSKFYCQEDRRKRTGTLGTTRTAFEKRERQRLIQESEQQLCIATPMTSTTTYGIPKESHDNPKATELSEGLAKVQINTYFSLNQDHSSTRFIIRTKPCVTSSEADITPTDQRDGVNYYLHPEENLYVCRTCLKRFKLRVMVKVHHCPRTHCSVCQLLVASCSCQNDSSNSGSQDWLQCESPVICKIEEVNQCKPEVIDLEPDPKVDPKPEPEVHPEPDPEVDPDHEENIDDAEVDPYNEDNPDPNVDPDPQIDPDLAPSSPGVAISMPTGDSDIDDNQHQSSHSTISISRTESIASFDEEDEMSSTGWSMEPLVGAVERYLTERGETSDSGDDDYSHRLVSCDQCTRIFFSEDLLTEHIKLVHPHKTNCQNQVEAMEKHVVTPVISLLANNSCPISSKNLTAIQTSIAGAVKSKESYQDHSYSGGISARQVPTATNITAKAKIHQWTYCKTCRTTFSSPEAYSKHTSSCVRVWSKASPSGPSCVPVRTNSKCFVLVRVNQVVARKMVAVSGDNGGLVLGMCKEDDNYGTNNRTLNNSHKFTVTGLDKKVMVTNKDSVNSVIEPKPVTEENNFHSENMLSDIKMEVDVESDWNIEDSLDIKDVMLIREVAPLSDAGEVPFPLPIAVGAVKQECLQEPSPQQCVELPVPVQWSEPPQSVQLVVAAPRRRRPWSVGRRQRFAQALLIRRQKLQQLQMVPTVRLTRCDSLLSGQAAQSSDRLVSNGEAALHRCPQCALVFPSVSALRVHSARHSSVCWVCRSAHVSRGARAVHTAAQHEALISHIVGCAPRPDRVSLHFLGAPPDDILPSLDRG